MSEPVFHPLYLNPLSFFSSNHPYSCNIYGRRRGKLSPIGNEIVTVNVIFCICKPSTLSIHSRAFECVRCTCLCLCKPTPQGWDVGVHLPSRPWSKEKLRLAGTSRFGRKHCYATRAFLPVFGKTIRPMTLCQRSASPVANDNDDTSLQYRLKRERETSKDIIKRWQVHWVCFSVDLDRHKRDMIGNPREEHTSVCLPSQVPGLWHHLLWSMLGYRPGIFHV